MNYPFKNHIAQSLARRVSPALSWILPVALSACVALPPADKPPVLNHPQTSDFLPAQSGQWPAADWWKQFNDPQLDHLIAQALLNSPSMAVAQARVEQANAAVKGVAANAGANLAADGSVTRELYPTDGYYPPPIAGSILNSASLALNFSYDFDWWGRNRSALAASLGRSAAAQAEVAGAGASLSAAVASVYFQWQAVSNRIALQDQIQAQRDRLVELEARRVKTGLNAGDTVTPLQADAAAPRQTRVQLETQREQLYYQLKSLVSSPRFPAQLEAHPLPTVSEGLPSNLPLDLLARRADIAVSRQQVEASLHDVEAARAAFYPDVNLSAFVGFSSIGLSELLHSDNFTYGVTPAFHLPIFDAGRLRAGLATNRAGAALAVAQYDQAVQTAVGEVNDAAVKLKGASREQASLHIQINARERDLASAQRRVRAGLADGRDVVRDRLSLLVLNDQELLRQQHALAARIDLIKALGGGYQENTESATQPAQPADKN